MEGSKGHYSCCDLAWDGIMELQMCEVSSGQVEIECAPPKVCHGKKE